MVCGLGGGFGWEVFDGVGELSLRREGASKQNNLIPTLPVGNCQEGKDKNLVFIVNYSHVAVGSIAIRDMAVEGHVYNDTYINTIISRHLCFYIRPNGGSVLRRSYHASSVNLRFQDKSLYCNDVSPCKLVNSMYCVSIVHN